MPRPAPENYAWQQVQPDGRVVVRGACHAQSGMSGHDGELVSMAMRKWLWPTFRDGISRRAGRVYFLTELQRLLPLFRGQVSACPGMVLPHGSRG